MPETRRLLEAASALSHALRAHGVPHAFHGSLFVAVLTNSPQADVRTSPRPFPSLGRALAFCDLIAAQEIFCIVEGGSAHPFRRVRHALTGNADLSITPSPWSNRYSLMPLPSPALARSLLKFAPRSLHVKYNRCIPPIEVFALSAPQQQLGVLSPPISAFRSRSWQRESLARAASMRSRWPPSTVCPS